MKAILRLFLLFVLFPSTCLPAMYKVSSDGTGDFWSIQSAIDASSDGDEIIVSPGVYSTSIYFDGKNIIVRSTDPFDPDIVASTIISGEHTSRNSPMVRFEGSEDETCELSGFTIRDGYNHDWHAGAINGGGSEYGEREGSHACIRNCVITDNTVDHFEAVAGGVFGFDGLIVNCIIADNSVIGRSYDYNAPWSFGGGLAYCNGVIDGCIIRGNLGYVGGGLYACNGIISNSQIIDNEASFDDYGYIDPEYGDGGGLTECNGTIENCLISGNRAYYGGGLYECRASIIGCTISDNIASDFEDEEDPDGYGGGPLRLRWRTRELHCLV